jgi:hypothetical protein
MVPDHGGRYPKIVLSRVDLPAPFGPITPMIAARSTASETDWRISSLL